MGLTDLTVTSFLGEIDSPSPAPGGGSASALAGAIGCCLARMVGHLTMGKKKYEALGDEAKSTFLSAMVQMETLKQQLTSAVDRDTEAFNQVMRAFRMPKGTNEEKALRDQKIQEATLEAIHSPEDMANKAMNGLRLMDTVLRYGNGNTLSDIGVAVLLLSSAVEGAILNIKINLPGLADRDLAERYALHIGKQLKDMTVLKESLMTEIHDRLQS